MRRRRIRNKSQPFLAQEPELAARGPAGTDESVFVAPDNATQISLTFDDNRLASMLFGQYGQNLALIERRLGSVANSRGNTVTIEVDRIVLSRPAVEAGERLGFLPGVMREKVDPYLRPIYDALYDLMDARIVERALQSGEIEIAPLAFMRGRTLANAVVILDEAQNTTSMQMKMFLTRLGENSHMIVTGDPSQVDLPPGQTSGLADATKLLAGIEGIAHVTFSAEDVIRHELVARIVAAYEAAALGANRAREADE